MVITVEGDGLGLTEVLGEALPEGEALADGDREADGVVAGSWLGEILADGDRDREALLLADADGERLAEALTPATIKPTSVRSWLQLKLSTGLRTLRLDPNLKDPGGPLSSQSDKALEKLSITYAGIETHLLSL